MNMDRLNYHHLRYFRAVALEGNLTQTAERLNLSQSALSTQIKQLEERLGHALFERKGRRLILTEAGQIALDHANRIFEVGEDLVATFTPGEGRHRPLKIGAQSTLSRNFQLRFLRPVLEDDARDLVLSSGPRSVLLDALEALALDVVLSTEPPPQGAYPRLEARRLAAQAVGLYGIPDRVTHRDLRRLLTEEPVILPTESSIRTGFDALTTRLSVAPRIAAQVDDMAMVRLLAREGIGLAIAPEVVFADEVAQGVIVAAGVTLDIEECFYAITATRSFPHPRLGALLAAAGAR